MFLTTFDRASSFNPRPYERGDDTEMEEANTIAMFQSTPLREGRLKFKLNKNKQEWFQSTPLREGRPFDFLGL